jgi:hypothetical protein
LHVRNALIVDLLKQIALHHPSGTRGSAGKQQARNDT